MFVIYENCISGSVIVVLDRGAVVLLELKWTKELRGGINGTGDLSRRAIDGGGGEEVEGGASNSACQDCLAGICAADKLQQPRKSCRRLGCRHSGADRGTVNDDKGQPFYE